MSDRYATDIIRYAIPLAAAVPPGNVSSGDWLAMDNRVTVLEALRDLGELADVVITSPANGAVLQWDSGTSRWIDGVLPNAVAFVKNDNATVVVNGADRLNFDKGLVATQNGSLATQADINIDYGGSGSADTISRSDHSHNPVLYPLSDISATGVLNSGSRTLVTINAGPLVNGVPYDIRADAFVHARNNVNSGSFQVRLQIDGGTRKDMARTSVGGVPISYPISQVYSNYPGSGSTVAVIFSVAHVSGDPTDFMTGQLVVQCSPRR